MLEDAEMVASQPLNGQFVGVPGEAPVGVAAQDCTRCLAQTQCRASACELGLRGYLLANRPRRELDHVDCHGRLW